MIKFWKYKKYDRADAERLLFFLRSHNINCRVIGSIQKKGHSNNDIDIHIPGKTRDEMLPTLVRLFNPHNESDINIEDSDWGGFKWYGTVFGDIDFFFKGNTDKFDY